MTDDWFGRRTHHWQDWDLAALVAAKQRTGQKVSLVVPPATRPPRWATS